MQSRLKVAQEGMILVLIPVIFEVIFVACLGVWLLSTTKQYYEIKHSREALLEVQRMYSFANKTAQLAGSTQLSPDEKSAEVKKLIPLLRKNYKLEPLSAAAHPELIELTKESEETKKLIQLTLEKADQDIHRRRNHQVSIVNTALTKEQIYLFVMQTQELHRKFIEIQNRIVKEEPLKIKQVGDELLLVIITGLIITLIASWALLARFSRNIVGRLNSIAAKAQLIAAEKPLPPTDARADEIGDLDRTITDGALNLSAARMKESAFFNSTAHIVCALDNKLKIKTIGESSLRAWHLTRDELLGKSVLSLLPSQSIDDVRTQFEQIAKSKTDGTIETIIRCGDGVARNMLWKISWQANSFYCIVQDVSELRSIEQLRQHFFSMVSHDLRSPLTAVGMNIQMIAAGTKGEVSDEVSKELQGIEANLSQLMNLVNGILALERIEATKTSLILSAVNAADLCEAAKESLASLAAERGVIIKGPKGSALFWADELKMEQAVTNLIDGVLKLSKRGSQIELHVRTQDTTGFIEVTQAQYNLAPNEAYVFFDKLQQTPIDSENSAGASRLGFALVKAIVDLHNGSVGVELLPGGGCTFWIGNPLYEDDSP